MNGRDLLADTNILIRFLKGDADVRDIVADNNIHISFITELELYSKASLTPADEDAIANLVGGSTVLPYQEAMRNLVIGIRRGARLKLPDCIIAATAVFHHLPLLTQDMDFKRASDVTLISLTA